MSYKYQIDEGNNCQITATLPAENSKDVISQLNYLIQPESGHAIMLYDPKAAEVGRTEVFPCWKKSSWPNTTEVTLTVTKNKNKKLSS